MFRFQDVREFHVFKWPQDVCPPRLNQVVFDVLGCAWSFWLFHVAFGSKGQFGCFGLFQPVFGLFKFALSCVLLFEVPSDLQVGSRCSKLVKFVFNRFRLISIV